MFPYTEEFPPEGREINPVSLPPVATGRLVVWLAPVGRWGLCSICLQTWLFGLIRQLFGEQQEGEW